MLIPKDVAQQIIFDLRQNGGHAALSQLRDQNTVFCTTSPEADASRPFNCLVNLMQWLNERGQAQFGTHPQSGKRKIYTSMDPDDAAAAMEAMNKFEIITVANKKANRGEQALKYTQTPLDSAQWEGRQVLAEFGVDNMTSPQVHLPFTGSDEKMRTVHRLYMMAAFTLNGGDTRQEAGNVSAILADASGRIIGWGRNLRGFNSTLHAEVNLIQGLYANRPSDYARSLNGAVLYTTLKPCIMCAGMIHRAGKGKIEVIFGQDDKGLDAQGTKLDITRQNWLLGSKEKAIFMPDSEKPLSKALEEFRDQDKVPVHGRAARGIVDSLGQPGAVELMAKATAQLKLKTEKYLDPASFEKKKYTKENTEKVQKYEERKRVLEHISAFLNSKKAL
jgi:tRNA(Arg) A34 adenosine deaminase TadA